MLVHSTSHSEVHFLWCIYYAYTLFPVQTLYEAVCSDRNLCSKNLIEARDEITELKRKLKIMSHQIDQLKEEIAAKESALVKSNMELMHVEREKEGLNTELSSRKQELDTTRQLVDSQKAEERRLRKILGDADAEMVRQKKELEQVGVLSSRICLSLVCMHTCVCCPHAIAV